MSSSAVQGTGGCTTSACLVFIISNSTPLKYFVSRWASLWRAVEWFVYFERALFCSVASCSPNTELWIVSHSRRLSTYSRNGSVSEVARPGEARLACLKVNDGEDSGAAPRACGFDSRSIDIGSREERFCATKASSFSLVSFGSRSSLDELRDEDSPSLAEPLRSTIAWRLLSLLRNEEAILWTDQTRFRYRS